MEFGNYTTLVKTQDGKIYDLGLREYPPIHYHPGNAPCPECLIVNAWTEKEKDCVERAKEKNMGKINKDELLVKIATVLRLPAHTNLALEGDETGYAYDRRIIGELLDEISTFFIIRDPQKKDCVEK